MLESSQSCFELSIRFPIFFSRELFLVAVHGWFAVQPTVHSALSFQFMNFSEAMFYKNYLTSDFHTNTAIARRVCLLVKMASKTVIRPIQQGPTITPGILRKSPLRNEAFSTRNFPI